MKKEDFEKLRVGDIVLGTSGTSYVIVNDSPLVGVRSIQITNPLEWKLFNPPPKKKKIWSCKIGECEEGDLPFGSDGPMREAVEEAYKKITGKEPDFLFSGWGGKLDEYERMVVDETQKREEDGL